MINRYSILIFAFVLNLFFFFGCLPYYLHNPGHHPPDPYTLELNRLKHLPLKERIDAYLAKHPEAGVRHLGWCGTPDETARYAFVLLLEDASTREIIPFLERKEPLLRSAVHTLIRQRGQDLPSPGKRSKRKGVIVDYQTPEGVQSQETSRPPATSATSENKYRWIYDNYKISDTKVLKDLKAAYEEGSSRIRLELILYIKPDASDEEIFQLLDAIIHDSKLLVFQTDTSWF